MKIEPGTRVRIIVNTPAEPDPHRGKIFVVAAISQLPDGKPVYLIEIGNRTLAYFDGELEVVDG